MPQVYYYDDLDTANRAIAAIPCLDLSIEAARWRIHHKLTASNVVVMIQAQGDQDAFFAYAGDALKLQKHAGLMPFTSTFGGQKVDTAVIDAIECHKAIAALELAGLDLIFIR